MFLVLSMRHWKKKKNKSGVKYVYKLCDCGARLRFVNPNFMKKGEQGNKAHAHCIWCQLEWHFTADGRLYAHPFKNIGSGMGVYYKPKW